MPAPHLLQAAGSRYVAATPGGALTMGQICWAASPPRNSACRASVALTTISCAPLTAPRREITRASRPHSTWSTRYDAGGIPIRGGQRFNELEVTDETALG